MANNPETLFPSISCPASVNKTGSMPKNGNVAEPGFAGVAPGRGKEAAGGERVHVHEGFEEGAHLHEHAARLAGAFARGLLGSRSRARQVTQARRQGGKGGDADVREVFAREQPPRGVCA